VRADTVDRIRQAWAKQDPDLDTSPLEVVGRLLICARYCENAIVSALQPFGLTFADFDVINTLRRIADEDGTNPKVLARTSLITSGAMTTRLDRLERAGHIVRGPDPADRRGVLVRLTPQGETLAAKALDAVISADRSFLEPLSQRQRDSMAAALKLLALAHEPE
jgi:DNA-binding MarR family transcriptional regulator